MIKILTSSSTNPIIFKEVGLALTNIGFVAVRDEEVYTSLFLKLESPLLKKSECATPCGVETEALRTLLQNSRCQNKAVIGNAEELRRINLGGETELDQTVFCLAACLEEEPCKGVTVLKKRNNNPGQCILRKAGFSRLKKDTAVIAEIVMACLTEDTEKFCKEHKNAVAKAFAQSNNATLSHMWRKTTQSIEAVRRLTNYQTLRGNNREKRAWQLVPLAGILVSGLSLFEAYKVSQHIKGLERSFEGFVKETVKVQEQQIIFEQQTVKILSGISRRMEALENELECEVRQLATQIATVQRINEFKGFLDNLFDPIARNRLDGPATLQVLDPEKLRTIAKCPKLKGTVYEDNPEMLMLGRLILIDAVETPEAFSSHLVLALPKLKQQDLYPLFKTHAIMFTPSPKQCGKIKVPPFIIQKSKNEWREMDLASCTSRGQVKLCLSVEQGKVPCLDRTEGFKDCQIAGTKCATETNELPSGIMINSLEQVKGIRRNETELKLIPRASYYSYTDYSTLVFDKRVIRALDQYQTELFWAAPTMLSRVDYLRRKTSNYPDIEELRQMVLQQQVRESHKISMAPNWGLVTELCAWTSMAAWAAFLAWQGREKIKGWMKNITEMYQRMMKKTPEDQAETANETLMGNTSKKEAPPRKVRFETGKV